MSDAMHITATALVAPGKGILAADESTGTIKKRFDTIGVDNTEDTAGVSGDALHDPGLGEHISGVILFDETIHQSTDDGMSFVEGAGRRRHDPGHQGRHRREAARAVPGRDGDRGARRAAGAAGGVRELGARFAKWRATIIIGAGTPTNFAIDANAHAMARYAALCQEADIVPIVEPEILMDGDHDLAACEGPPGARSPRSIASSRRTASSCRVRC